ncbi:hypothetical protein [Candidatus Liberibacter africanus]|nr:hypothetical protein [Candidatus Liberibacter africanus]
MAVAIRDTSTPPPVPGKDDCEKIDKMTEKIKDEPLKQALVRFGRAVVGCSYCSG